MISFKISKYTRCRVDIKNACSCHLMSRLINGLRARVTMAFRMYFSGKLIGNGAASTSCNHPRVII